MDLDEIRERVRKRRAPKNSEAPQKWCLIYDSGNHGFFKVLASEDELQLVTDELEKEGMPKVLAQYLSEEELDSNFDSDTRDIVDKDSIEPAQEKDIAGLTTSFYKIIEDNESNEDSEELVNSVENDTEESRSDKIYNIHINNIENTLGLSPWSFTERIKGIQKVLDKNDLSDYEADRLRLLQGWLSFKFFKANFLDDDFYEYREEYYNILDKIDDFVGDMSKQTKEAEFMYYTAQMYSVFRFEDALPSEKLNEFWNKLSRIKLNANSVEFEVSFWKETAKEIYDQMSEFIKSYDDDSEYDDPFYSANSYEYVKAKVIDIISKQSSINKSEIFSFSRIENNLGIYLRDLRKIIMEIEDEFDIVIPDSEVDYFRSVGDIISYVKQNIDN